MEEALYDQFYEVEQRHWWFVARQEILLRYFDQVVRLPPEAQILDIGCGTGALLEELSKRGRAYGVDASERAIEYCRKRGLTNVYCGNLDAVPTNQPFDCITLFDVLEHIENDIGVLKECSRLLTDDGCVLITVPAYQWMWSEHDVRNHHKRRYLASSLRAVAQQAGFRVVHCTYFNTLLFPLAVIRRMWGKVTGDAADDLELPPPPLNTFLRSVFRIEKYLVPWVSLPFGVSIFCHATKRTIPS